MPVPLAIADFNEAPESALQGPLLSCCASDSWVQRLLADRPYADRDALLSGSDAAFVTLTDSDLADALAGHPRIGDRVEGSGQSADHSRAEQAQVSSADTDIREQIRAGNLAYEQRFDRVFLIRAAGRAPTEILGELQRRLANDDASEHAEMREQLRQITRLRLEAFVR